MQRSRHALALPFLADIFQSAFATDTTSAPAATRTSVVITATRADTNPDDLPPSVNSIDHAELDRELIGNYRNLARTRLSVMATLVYPA
jgi:outer membrane receptor protein involved in Fe transport